MIYTLFVLILRYLTVTYADSVAQLVNYRTVLAKVSGRRSLPTPEHNAVTHPCFGVLLHVFLSLDAY